MGRSEITLLMLAQVLWPREKAATGQRVCILQQLVCIYMSVILQHGAHYIACNSHVRVSWYIHQLNIACSPPSSRSDTTGQPVI